MADRAEKNRFSSLPNSFCEQFLLQAFQQLDQRQLYTVLPLVCRLWHELHLRVSNSLEVALKKAEDTAQFSSWLQRNGANLHHLSVFILPELGLRYGPMPPFTNAPLTNVPAAIEMACTNLRSLDLRSWPQGGLLPVLSSLTQLTNVQLHQSHAGLPSFASGFFATLPSSLQSLSLVAYKFPSGQSSISAALSHLTQVTHLQFIDMTLKPDEVAALHKLSGLKELTLKVEDCEALQHIPRLPCTTLQVRNANLSNANIRVEGQV
jgi:hypothetical protein